MDFERRVHRESQKVIPPNTNSGYPPIIVSYCRFPPVLLDQDMRPVVPLQPNPAFLQAAKELGKLADFLVISANGPHEFMGDLEKASGLKVLSMITVTLEKLQQRGWHQHSDQHLWKLSPKKIC